MDKKQYYSGGIIILILISVLYSAIEFVPPEREKREENKNENENTQIIKNFSFPLSSLTKEKNTTITKNGYGIRCSNNIYYPLHLDGETLSISLEKQKIFTAQDIVLASTTQNISDSKRGEKEFQLEDLSIARRFHSVELNNKKLTGDFFSVVLAIEKGDSGRGVFDTHGNCSAMLIGYLENSHEAIFVNLPK